MVMPVPSWNQAGKPPTVGDLSIGPMRVRTAWAGAAATMARAAAAAITLRFDFMILRFQGEGWGARRALPDDACPLQCFDASRGMALPPAPREQPGNVRAAGVSAGRT